MAGAVERLEFLLSLNADGAIKGFKNVGDTADKELSKADSKLGKVGGNLTKFGVGAMATAGLVGGGLLKAAGSFEDLAIKSGQFADATGLNVTKASQWIEVAGDLGVESDALEGSINKMNKTAENSPEKFAAIGAKLVYTKDGALDVNGTLLNTIDALNGIEDPARRAAGASDILGKGWTGMSELIKTGADGLKTSLDSVSQGQVINPDELQKAKDYRDSMDKLKDSVTNLVLQLGQGAAPVIGTLSTVISGVVDWFTRLNEATDGWVGRGLAVGAAALGVVGALSAIAGQALKMRDNIMKGVDALGKVSPELIGVAGLAGAFVVAFQAQETQTDRTREATKRYTEALKAQKEGQKDALNQQIAADFQSGSFLTTMDKLGLSTRDAADVVLGKSVPAYDALKTKLTALLDTGVTPTDQAVQQLGEQFGIGVGEAQGFLDRMTVLTGGVKGARDAMDVAKKVTEELGGASRNTSGDVQTLGHSMDGARLTALAHKLQMDELQASTKAMDDAYRILTGHLDERQSWRDAQAAMMEFGGETTHTQESTDNLIRSLGTYVEATKGIPTELKTAIYAELDAGKVDLVEAQLNAIARTRSALFEPKIKGPGGVNPNSGTGYASGTSSATPGVHLVGENGPELVAFGGGERVIPAGQTAAMLGSGGTYNITINTGADPRQVITEVKRYLKGGGTFS